DHNLNALLHAHWMRVEPRIGILDVAQRWLVAFNAYMICHGQQNVPRMEDGIRKFTVWLEIPRDVLKKIGQLDQTHVRLVVLWMIITPFPPWVEQLIQLADAINPLDDVLRTANARLRPQVPRQQTREAPRPHRLTSDR